MEIAWPASALHAGESARLAATVKDSAGAVIEGARVGWSVSDTSVATVDPDGTVHGRRFGTTQVTATAGPASATGALEVGYARVAKVNIVPDTVRQAAGTHLSVSVSVTDASGAPVPLGVTWSTSDSAVVRSDGRGGLVAAAPGSVLIRATVDGVGDSAVVVVGPPAALAVYPDTAVLLVGDQARLLAAEIPGSPAETYDLTTRVAWTSSAPGVASVDAAGRVAAVSSGEATITATVPASGTSSSAKVYVLRYSPALQLATWQPADIHACGLTADGRAFCTAWTRMFAAPSGAFGSVQPADRCRQVLSSPGSAQWAYGRCSRVPLEVDGGHRFVSLAVSATACAADDGGAVWCWGAQPTRVSGVSGATQVVATGSLFCALDGAGQATCWGTGSAPAVVPGDHHFRTLSAGAGAVCGIDADGATWCWGDNSRGQLGDGTRTSASTPVQVQTAVRFDKLALGYDFSCALDAAGLAYCWGKGLGTAAAGGGYTPSRAPATQSFRALGTRAGLSCGVTVAGTIVCWNASVDPSAPNAGPAGSDWVDVRADVDRTCAVASSGRVACWTERGIGGAWDVADVPRGG